MTYDNPFFVVCPQKCGSSLLTTLLELYPKVAIATSALDYVHIDFCPQA